MVTINLYDGLKLIKEDELCTIVFVSVSLSKNEGGERKVLENVKKGPLRKNMHEKLMIGLEKEDGDVLHIYKHSILEVITPENHFKLILQ